MRTIVKLKGQIAMRFPIKRLMLYTDQLQKYGIIFIPQAQGITCLEFAIDTETEEIDRTLKTCS